MKRRIASYKHSFRNIFIYGYCYNILLSFERVSTIKLKSPKGQMLPAEKREKIIAGIKRNKADIKKNERRVRELEKLIVELENSSDDDGF